MYIKEAMELRSREIEHESENGFGSIDTEYFRYTVEPRHHVKDASMYQTVKTLELRTATDNDRIAQIDEIFLGVFDKLIVTTNRDFIDFATLVDKLEDIEQANGGTVRDEPANERVTYTAPDGATIVFSVAAGRISMSTRDANSIQTLLETAQGYRLALKASPRCFSRSHQFARSILMSSILPSYLRDAFAPKSTQSIPPVSLILLSRPPTDLATTDDGEFDTSARSSRSG